MKLLTGLLLLGMVLADNGNHFGKGHGKGNDGGEGEGNGNGNGNGGGNGGGNGNGNGGGKGGGNEGGKGGGKGGNGEGSGGGVAPPPVGGHNNLLEEVLLLKAAENDYDYDYDYVPLRPSQKTHLVPLLPPRPQFVPVCTIGTPWWSANGFLFTCDVYHACPNGATCVSTPDQVTHVCCSTPANPLVLPAVSVVG